MIAEAKMVRNDNGLAPEGEGWFVLNAREARWLAREEFGRRCRFEGKEPFPELGFVLRVLLPGKPNCMYHGENLQEDFLVLSGECLLLVNGEERRLREWDFVHCPPWVEHVFVGAGTEPCLILMVGARRPDEEVRYPVDELALRHGAGVTKETRSQEEAYAPFSPVMEVPYREGDLPTWR